MKKCPNVVQHMTFRGFWSGFILALIYGLIFFAYGGGIGGLIFMTPFMLFFAILFGSIPGTFIGYFVSLLLYNLLKDVFSPFMRDDLQKKRVTIYSSTFLLSLFLAVICFLLEFLILQLLSVSVFIVVVMPSLIAAIASTYAAHRYMFRLLLWSENLDTRKSKRKNDAYSRLTESHADNLPDDYQPDHQAQSEINS